MADKISVPLFKLTIPLGAFTVLVGQNGCGKTTVLRAVRERWCNENASTLAGRLAAYRYVDAIIPPGQAQTRYSCGGGLYVHDVIVAALTASHERMPCVFDNFGTGLHPVTIARLVTALREIGAQVVAATHSPDVADCLTHAEVIVMHGGKARPLSDHPESAKWSHLTRTGEFWSTVGESWVSDPKENAPVGE